MRQLRINAFRWWRCDLWMLSIALITNCEKYAVPQYKAAAILVASLIIR